MPMGCVFARNQDPTVSIGRALGQHRLRSSVRYCFDDLALMSAADNEVIDTVGAVYLHDVPQDRPAADLDHGLRNDGGLFAQTGTVTSCKNDCFHEDE